MSSLDLNKLADELCKAVSQEAAAKERLEKAKAELENAREVLGKAQQEFATAEDQVAKIDLRMKAVGHAVRELMITVEQPA